MSETGIQNTKEVPTATVPEAPPVQGVELDNFRPILPGETFEGAMPILPRWEDAETFRDIAAELYGELRGHGRYGDVYIQGDRATKIFREPTLLSNIYEAEFSRHYGGRAGLPQHYGVIPNGYQMETIRGKTLMQIFQEAGWGRDDVKFQQMRRTIFTQEKAQSLIDLIAEFHHVTGRAHGDLAWLNNIILDDNGSIRLLDPVWGERFVNNPEEELGGMYRWVTNVLEAKEIKLPQTISQEESNQRVKEFIQEVENILVKDESNKIIGLKGTKVKIKAVDNQVLAST